MTDRDAVGSTRTSAACRVKGKDVQDLAGFFFSCGPLRMSRFILSYDGSKPHLFKVYEGLDKIFLSFKITGSKLSRRIFGGITIILGS